MGLQETGTIGSEQYVAVYLYPELGISLEITSPREGNPALLAPGEVEISITYFSAARENPENCGFYLSEDMNGLDNAIPLETVSSTECDEHGLCSAVLVSSVGLEGGRLYTLCVDTGEEVVCRPRSVYFFDEVPNPLKIAHITDLHLGGIVNSSRTLGSFHDLMDALEANRSEVDVIIVTGDIGHDGRAHQTRAFYEGLERITIPVITCSGNHDYHEGNIVNYLQQITPRLNHATRLGPYLIVALDSGPGKYSVEPMSMSNNSVGLWEDQISWFSDTLQGEGTSKIVFLHHPPYAFSGSVIGRRRKEFLRVSRNNNVSLILAGHTHLNEVYDFYGTGYGLSPRTGSSPKADRLPLTLTTARSTERIPGYRLIRMAPDGSFTYRFVQVHN